MDFFEVEHLRSVLKGRWLRRPDKSPTLGGIGIDSREDLTGRAFVAIKGETHDGHGFLQAAAQAGAALLIVDRDPSPGVESLLLAPHVGVLHVDDTRKALSRLALAYRRTLRGTKVIAVTGSAGKTTTKRLIHGVLSTQWQGTSSPKSFNNNIGLPLTILQARLSDKFLVVEIGMNAPGEIAQLAAIAEPDLAVITSIGRAHLGGLGSVEAIANEKASILKYLQANGVAILHADAPLLRSHYKLAKHRVLFGEADDADLRLTARGVHAGATPAWWFEINGRQRFDLAMPGKHNAMNALAAVAVGRRLGLDDASIAAGLKSIEPAAMRMTMQRAGTVTIYNDAYNANPDSMIAALETFAELAERAPRRVVVLGDMLELGDASATLHSELGEHLVNVDQRVPMHLGVFVGQHSASTAAQAAKRWGRDRALHVPVLDTAAAKQIALFIQPGDAVLVKASRGMGLEKVVKAIEDLHAEPTGGVPTVRTAWPQQMQSHAARA